MPKTAKEIIDNGLNNDILSFKKMLDTYSFSMDSSNPDKKRLEEISDALGRIMKTNNAIEIEDCLEKIGDVKGFLTEKKEDGKSLYDVLTDKMSGTAKDKFDKLLNSVNGQFGYGVTDEVLKDNEATRIQENIDYKIEQEEKEKKEEEKEKKKEKEEEANEKDEGKDKDKEEFLKKAKENGWDSEEEQQFLSDLYDAYKIEEDPDKKKKFGDIMDQVSTINTWNLDKKYGFFGMWANEIKSLFGPGIMVGAQDMGNGITAVTYRLPSSTDALLEKFAQMKGDLMKEGNEIMGRHEQKKAEEKAKEETTDTPWRKRTSYNELTKEEYGENYFNKPGMMTEKVKQKEKEKNTPSLGL